MDLNKALIIKLAEYIEQNNDLEIELRKYKKMVKFFLQRENKLQRIETMYKNKDVNLSILSEILKEEKR